MYRSGTASKVVRRTGVRLTSQSFPGPGWKYYTGAVFTAATRAALIATLTVTSLAHADPPPELSYAMGAEVGLLGGPQDDLPMKQAGCLIHVALTPGVPDYTTEQRGYIWRIGPAVDMAFGVGELDDQRYVSGSVGLRLEIAYSQRRMGLLEVSGRGGFYLGGRLGLIHSRALEQPGPPILDGEVPTLAGQPRAEQYTGQLVAGTYVFLVDTRVRVGTELAAFGVAPLAGESWTVGGLLRVTLGHGAVQHPGR